MLKTILLPFAIAILKASASFAWDVLWQIATAAMVEVEKQWLSGGGGELKKQWVMDKAMEYIEQNAKLNFATRWVVKMVVSKIIDEIIKRLNYQFENHRWVEYVTDLKKYIEGFLPKF